MVAKAAGGWAVPVTVLTYVAARVGVSALHTTSTIQVKCSINLNTFFTLSHPSPHTLSKSTLPKRVERTTRNPVLFIAKKINYLLKMKCTSLLYTGTCRVSLHGQDCIVLYKKRVLNVPLLRIRDVYPGSEFFPFRIPGRNRIFSIPDFRSTSKEFKYFNPKNCSWNYDPGCSSRIQIPGSGSFSHPRS